MYLRVELALRKIWNVKPYSPVKLILSSEVNMKYILTLVIALIVMIGLSCMPEPVAAGIFDDFQNESSSGYVVDGVQKVILKNILIYDPESGKIFSIPVDQVRYKVISFDGIDIVDELLLMANANKSKTFGLVGLKIDEPYDMYSAGVYYDFARHWWGDEAPPIYVGALGMENGHMLFTVYAKVYLNEFLGKNFNGYSMNLDTMLGMEKFGNRDFWDGEYTFRKDTEPDGSAFIEAFWLNVKEKNTYGVRYGISW